MSDTIRFDDGAAYERFMGVWSQGAGTTFLDRLAAPAGGAWLDVGCGNGAFTELVVRRGAPAAVQGIDPSEGQLAYARARFARSGLTPVPEVQIASAMALPFADASFDVAVMPLVIFFVPDPPTGVAEMVRVVRPGGLVAAYAWDMPGGGFPYGAVQATLRDMGVQPPGPPHPEVSSVDGLRALWTTAGVETVETWTIPVDRTFASFDEYVGIVLDGSPFAATPSAADPDARAEFTDRLRARVGAPADGGTLTLHGWANAVWGRVPGGVRPPHAA